MMGCGHFKSKNRVCMMCYRPERREKDKPSYGPACLHCGREGQQDRRGLCNVCYRNIDIRVKYSRRKSDIAGCGVEGRSRPLPAEPCPHPPGSAGRVETLVARAAAEVQLWHPLDAGADCELSLSVAALGRGCDLPLRVWGYDAA